MRVTRVGAFILAAVGGAATATGQTVTINFDTDTAGSTVASGTVVDTLYAAWGVTFTHVGPGSCSAGDHVYANDDQPSGFGSPPNVVSTCAPPIASDISENLTGGFVQASFAQDANRVCIDVLPDFSTHHAVLNAYDAGNNPIGSVTSADGVTQTLCFSGAGIRSVRFSGDGDLYARFDDLTVTFTQEIPLSSRPALALLAVALAAVALWSLRRSA